MSRSQKWLGAGCAVALLCIWSAFVLIARTSAKHTLAAFDIAFMRFLFSSLAILPLLAWRVARASRLEAVLGSVILVRTFALGPLRTLMITALVPVISALGAVPLLREPLTPAVLIGLVCVTAGLLVGLRSSRAPRPTPEPA